MHGTLAEWLSGEAKSLVFGGLDGVCTSLALVWSGAAEGHVSSRSILVMGTAGLVSQGFSMGLGNYLGGSIVHESAATAVRSGLVMFLSFVGFGAIPLAACLVPAAWVTPPLDKIVLFAATALSLYILGAITGSLAKQSTFVSGTGMIATGLCAAAVSYTVSSMLQRLLHTGPLTP